MMKMVDTRQTDEYYTPLEVAKIKGITRQAVVVGCQKGKYFGAIKSQPDESNKQGLWFIPKATIDNPGAEFTPALFQQPADLDTLKNDFREMMRSEYLQHLTEIQQLHNEQTAILQQQIKLQTQEHEEKIKKLEEKISDLTYSTITNNNKTNEIKQSLNQLITESRAERQSKNNRWWHGLFGD